MSASAVCDISDVGSPAARQVSERGSCENRPCENPFSHASTSESGSCENPFSHASTPESGSCENPFSHASTRESTPADRRRTWQLAFALPRGQGTLSQVVQAFAAPGLSAISVMRDPRHSDWLRYELTTRAETRAAINAAIDALRIPLLSVRIE